MTEIVNNISLNIYEPESILKFYKNPKKKSIITKIIKNPEIPPAKKQIKIKYDDINESSIHLNEYNIFRPPGLKMFKRMRREENNLTKKTNINDNKNVKILKKNQNQNLIINRKYLEKLNKNIPNNLYDYLHPYEYTYYSKKFGLSKILSEIKKPHKKNQFKFIKLTDEELITSKLTKYRSSNLFFPLKSGSNKKLFLTARNLKNYKTTRNDINTFKNTMPNNNIKNKTPKIKLKKNEEYYDYYSDDYSSSVSFTSKINNDKLNTQTNFKKRLFINGNEITNFNKLLYFNTLSTTKNINNKKKVSKPKRKSFIKYNQKVFNRNNKIITPIEEMKKLIFKSDNEKSDKKLKQSHNFINYMQNIPILNYNKNITKDKKERFRNGIIQLNKNLNENKFYMISDKIDREKYKEKLEELEKKMNYREDKTMISKDILF